MEEQKPPALNYAVPNTRVSLTGKEVLTRTTGGMLAGIVIVLGVGFIVEALSLIQQSLSTSPDKFDNSGYRSSAACLLLASVPMLFLGCRLGISVIRKPGAVAQQGIAERSASDPIILSALKSD